MPILILYLIEASDLNDASRVASNPAGTPGVHRGVADHAADALVAAGARWRARTLVRALATPGQLAEIQPWDVGTTGRTSIEPPARSVGMRPAIDNARRCPEDDS